MTIFDTSGLLWHILKSLSNWFTALTGSSNLFVSEAPSCTKVLSISPPGLLVLMQSVTDAEPQNPPPKRMCQSVFSFESAMKTTPALFRGGKCKGQNSHHVPSSSFSIFSFFLRILGVSHGLFSCFLFSSSELHPIWLHLSTQI